MLRLPERLKRGLIDWGLLSLCVYSLTLPALHLFSLEEESLRSLLLTAVLAAAVCFVSALPRRWMRALGRLLLAVTALRWALASPLLSAARALLAASAAYRPAQHIVLLYADLLVPLFIALMIPYVRLLMQGEPGFSSPLLLTNVLMIWFAGARGNLTPYLPAMATLPLLYAYAAQAQGWQAGKGRGRAFLKALPVAALIALLAFALTPPYRSTLPPLEEKADELRQLINDYFFFTDSRENFSLASEGYQPMGEKGLGGKPAISNTPVMEVQTDSRVYLRGSILNQYNGRAWYDTLSNERYGYASVRFAGLRDALLDADLPQEALRLGARSLEIGLLSPMPSTLFVPQRLRTLSTQEGMVPYLNAASELFITRNLEPGDRYSLSYEPYVAGTAQTDSLADRLSGAEDARYEELKKDYLQLPAHLKPEGQVATLARSIVGGETQPYRMATLIRDYLKANFTYTLNVKDAPQDLDFVAHFLQTQEGYCTYFASAMTVLARSVGLPARYIEGFVASPAEGGGPSLVTGQHAHAWTEVYIPALGWVTFDATATTGDLPPQPEGDMGGGPDDSAPPEEPQQEPQPTAGPDESPSGASDPTPNPEPTPPPPEERQEPETQRGGGHLPWLWLLLILACAALIAQRIRATEPGRRAARESDPAAKLMIYWQALCAALALQGLPMQPQETLRAFARRIAPDDIGLRRLAESVSALLYGRKTPAEQDVTAARLYYQSAYMALPRRRRARLILSRLGQDLRLQLRRAGQAALGALRALWRRLTAAMAGKGQRRPRRGRRRRGKG